MAASSRDVVFVDGVRTPFGKAGPAGIYAQTRADDLVVRCIRELLRRNPQLPPERIDDVAVAATTQTGDQGLTIGRYGALLAGLPRSVPGYAIDRMCAGAMTAVTTTAAAIAFGAYDVAVAGGVEHMGHHPMGSGVDPNPRFLAERLVDPSALVMGNTAENLHDRFPHLTRERADAFAARQPGARRRRRTPTACSSPTWCRSRPARPSDGWGYATADEPPRPGTTLEGLAGLRTPFRPHGRVTAGNAAGLNDGATACLLAAEDVADELGLPKAMRLVTFAFAGVEPEVMGVGPVPATEKALAKAGLTIDDIGRFEVNEAFAVQVLAFLDHFGIADDDPRVNPRGGAIAVGHPLASSGRAPDDQPRARARGAPRGALRPDHDVHRAGHGRDRDLGEHRLGGRPMSERERGHARRRGRHRRRTSGWSTCRTAPGRAALVTLDNGSRPHPAEHVRAGRRWRAWTRRSTSVTARDRARRGRRGAAHGQAVRVRRRRRPVGYRQRQRPRRRSSRWPRPGTGCSGGSASCPCRRSRSSTARRWAAASSSRCTAPTARCRPARPP